MNASAIHNHFIEPAHRAVNTKRTTVTLSNPNGAVAAGSDSFNCDDILLGHGATYRLKDVIITSFDNKDSTFQPSNQFASKAIIHPEYEPEASEFESPRGTYLEGLRANPGGDGFMKLGDIKGEFAPSRKADGVSDQVANPLDQMGFTNLSNDVVTNDLQTSWKGSWDKV